MNKTKRIIGIASLATLSVTSLVLAITLPITLNRNHGSSISDKYFKGLNPTTSYLVGSSIKLNVEAVANPEQYDYYWFIKLNNSETISPLNGYSGASINLLNAEEGWNDANVYCALVKKSEANTPSNFLMANNKTASDKNDPEASGQLTEKDIAMWTSTKLELSEAFSISACNIGITKTDMDNGIVEDSKANVILVPKSQNVTLQANVSVNSAYQNYVVYTWYKNGQAIDGANQSTYTIAASEATGSNTYSCSVKLVSGPSESNVVQSTNSYKINVVNTTNITCSNTSLTVNNQSFVSKPIPAGNTVNLSASFMLGQTDLSNLSSNNEIQSVNYAWYHNGSSISNQPNANKLTLSDASTSASGEYTCTATVNFKNGGSISANSQPIIVNVVAPQTISVTQFLKNMTIMNGDSVKLSVNASLNGSQESLVYNWYYKAPSAQNWTELTQEQAKGNALSLTPENAYKANGYSFKCELSCSDPIQQVTPMSGGEMTLTVENPKFTVSTDVTPTTLTYGGTATLTANITSLNTGITSQNDFSTKYSYQWYKLVPASTYGAASTEPTWEAISLATAETLTIENLSVSDNHVQYKCLVYPNNIVNTTAEEKPAVKSTNVAADEPTNQQATVTHPFEQWTDPVTLNVAPFELTLTPSITANKPSSDSNPSTKVTNNLGNTFNLNVATSLADPYQSGLPAGYTYSYQWQQSTSENGEFQNIDSPTVSANGELTNVTSSQSGMHYYRCVVSIVPPVSSGGDTTLLKAKAVSASPVASLTSNTVSVNTFPKLQVTNTTQKNVSVAHNGSTVLKPTINVITNLTLGLNNQDSSSNTDINSYNPKYSWTFKPTNGNTVRLDSTNATNYPFIRNKSYESSALEIDSLYCNPSSNCGGQYNFSVSINNTSYALNNESLFTVTEDKATFTVDASVIAQIGGNEITLKADVNPISTSPEGSQDSNTAGGSDNADAAQPKTRSTRNTVQEDSSPSQSSYVFTWYAKINNPEGQPTFKKLCSNTSDTTSDTQKLTLNNLPNGVQESWNNQMSLFCMVEDQTTGEIEWNTEGESINITKPTVQSFNINGNNSVNYNQTVTLTATANPTFTVNGTNMSYTWEYQKGNEWITFQDDPSHVTITNTNSNNNQSSQLQLFNVNGQYNNLKVRCIATYGSFGSQTAETTLTVSTKVLTETTTENIQNLVTSINDEFSSSNWKATLQKCYSMTNDGKEPSNPISSTVTDAWLQTLLGSSVTSGNLKDMFGQDPVNLSAYLQLASTNVGESLTAAQDGSPETTPNNEVVVLRFDFTTLEGYTWPTSLVPSAANMLKTTPSNYKVELSKDNQTLSIYVKTDLKPGFVLTTQGNQTISLSNSNNTLTATVNASSSVTDYNWYAYNPTTKKSVLINQTNIQEVQSLFGENTVISIENGAQTSTLKLTGITVNSESLNGIQIYAQATLDRTNSYWQQWYTLTPFTINVSSTSVSPVPPVGGSETGAETH